jgi:hypothetical protein
MGCDPLARMVCRARKLLISRGRIRQVLMSIGDGGEMPPSPNKRWHCEHFTEWMFDET